MVLLSRCRMAPCQFRVSICPTEYVRLSNEAIFASRIAVLYGFVINASPPSIILFSSSISVSQLVTKIMGTLENVRILEHKVKPFSPGSLMSSKIKCGFADFTSSIVVEKFLTATASYPFPFSKVCNSSCIIGSSSMTIIL